MKLGHSETLLIYIKLVSILFVIVVKKLETMSSKIAVNICIILVVFALVRSLHSNVWWYKAFLRNILL